MSDEIAILKKTSLFVGLIVVGLGTLIGLGMIKSDGFIAAGTGHIRSLAQLAYFGRAPASVAAVRPIVSEVKLSCLKPKSVVCANCAQRVRLLGHACGPAARPWSVENIVNESNRFHATVFPLDNGQFTTDYMDLQPGANHLTVSMKDSRGRTHLKNFILIRGFAN